MTVLHLVEQSGRAPPGGLLRPAAAELIPARGARSAEWSPRRKVAFAVLSSLACWALLLIPLYALARLVWP